MVLTDRQRHDLHAGIYEYLLSRPGDAFQRAAAALAEADPDACHKNNNNNASTNNNSNNNNTTTAATNTTPSKSSSSSLIITPLLEKKWTAIPRLQKKVLELERAAAQHAKIHAHRTGASSHTADAAGGTRRMLPRLPATFVLQGHAAVVLAVEVHPVFTMVVSGSEDGTIKVCSVCSR
jgi:platelet-activating factor acetylhydrolase IB subunit alpha